MESEAGFMHFDSSVVDRLANNNFDLLRLLFASVVCVVHFIDLSGISEFNVVTYFLSSEVSVKAFFVISGFLIFLSYERSSSLNSYFEKRIRRIYPAYAVVVLICSFALFSVSTCSASDYFGFEWVKYLVANIIFLNFLQPTLPGVFEGNILKAVNGALWTLKIEVLFYFAVPIIGVFFRKFSRLNVLLCIYFVSIIYFETMQVLADTTGRPIFLELGRQLPGQLMWFISGALLLYYFSLFQRFQVRAVLLSLLVIVAGKFFPLGLIQPLALAVVVIFFGTFWFLGNFGKYGDFSYGVYITHFPIIQTLFSFGLFEYNPWSFAGFSVVLTLVSSITLWHLVEKRFLFRGNHYRQG
jgi:peptidoglycan/LPS O-acetylase OafA/YrhL